MSFHKNKMHSIFVFLTQIVCFVIVPSCQHYYETDSALADKKCPEERQTFDVEVPSEIACVFKCDVHPACAGMSYKASSSSCIGCRTYSDCTVPIGAFQDIAGTRFYGLVYNYLVSGVRPVPDNYLSASSVWINTNEPDKEYGPVESRICSVSASTSAGAWLPLYDQQDEWIKVQFWAPSLVVSVVTAGTSDPGYNIYVTGFTFWYSDDCDAFSAIIDPEGDVMVFPGNTELQELVINDLPYKVHAQCVSIIPTAWNGNIALRFDVIGFPLASP